MKQYPVAALRDCLCEDRDSARTRLRQLDQNPLRRLSRACMALQNLAAARRYALAQYQPRPDPAAAAESALDHLNVK